MTQHKIPDTTCESIANQLRDLADELEEDDCFGNFTAKNDTRTTHPLNPEGYQIVSSTIEAELNLPNYVASIEITERQ